MSTIQRGSITFTRALARFQTALTEEEISQFSSRFTSIDDVWDAINYLQKEQGSRCSLRNMNRLAPFINGLSRYSGVIEVFVQAQPEIMAFIWAPLKLLLQVASNYENHFDKLLDACQSIGENLPRFATYEKIFQYDERLQAVVYEDIMEFFRRMWKFFRRRSWHILLDSLWSDFQGRFQVILGNLQRHKDLLDKEAVSAEMQEASLARKTQEHQLQEIADVLDREIQKSEDMRRDVEAEFEKNEKDRVDRQRMAIFSWIDSIDCRDDRERAGHRRHPKTGLWLFDCKEFCEWFMGISGILWLTGKPGCGKTVLVSTIIEELESNRKQQVLYFFFDYKDTRKNNLLWFLRALTSQLLILNTDLLSCASEWLRQGPSSHASLTALKQHFLELLQLTSQPIHIVIDGLDECEQEDVSSIQRYIHQLVSKQKQREYLRICIASREIDIQKSMKGINLVKLKIGQENNHMDIQSYVISELQRVQEDLEPSISLTDDYLLTMGKKLVSLAGGMFLWVRLVIEGLFDITTFEEIEVTIKELPGGLDKAYGRILQRIESQKTSNHRQRQTLRILKWLACAQRPVRVPEVESWLVVDPGKVHSKLGRPIITVSGPLIEVLPDQRIQFVHFSAKEYVLKGDGNGQHTTPFLTPLAAHLNAFTICATYLCNSSLQSGPPSLTAILNGDYCLLSYSKNYWLHHLEACINLGLDLTTAKDLISLLRTLVTLRTNITFTDCSRSTSNLNADEENSLFHSLHAIEPQVRSVLVAIKGYENQLRKKYTLGWSVDELHTWHLNNHPLMLSRQYWGTQALLENHAQGILEAEQTDIDSKQKLRRLYGDQIYFCRHPACEGGPIPKGFSTALEREKHENKHSRPFHCVHSSCDYSKIGFATKRAHTQHVKKYHATNPVEPEINMDSLNYLRDLGQMGAGGEPANWGSDVQGQPSAVLVDLSDDRITRMPLTSLSDSDISTMVGDYYTDGDFAGLDPSQDRITRRPPTSPSDSDFSIRAIDYDTDGGFAGLVDPSDDRITRRPPTSPSDSDFSTRVTDDNTDGDFPKFVNPSDDSITRVPRVPTTNSGASARQTSRESTIR